MDVALLIFDYCVTTEKQVRNFIIHSVKQYTKINKEYKQHVLNERWNDNLIQTMLENMTHIMENIKILHEIYKPLIFSGWNAVYELYPYHYDSAQMNFLEMALQE